MEDINNSAYADVGWYPDYIQTTYKSTFWLKVSYLKNIILTIIIRMSIIIIILIIKLSKHETGNSNNKYINKDNNQNSNNTNNQLL